MLTCSSTRLPRYMGSQRNQIDAIGRLITTHVLNNDILLRQKHSDRQANVIDMCSGSGVASRWLRADGWIAHSVDQEPYTWHWNYYAMNATPDTLACQESLYRTQHNLPENTNIVEWWNTLIPSLRAPPYFEEHYAPNPQCQRMYFMPHVAHWLDQALYWHTSQDWSATPLLHSHFVSEVCSAMIRVANTSGTMKSFHAQWGGTTGHRLSDIQTLPCIKPFWLLDGPAGTASLHDVTQDILTPADLIYFDPPASVHQFSSSYHLLNAFSLGHYRVPKASGKHGEKAGILSGAHSSAFSKKASVQRAWQDWIVNVQKKAPWLVVTYPKEGLLSTEKIAMTLQQHGRHTVSRHDLGDIFVYIVKTNTRQNPLQIKKMLTKVADLPRLGEYYAPQKLSSRFSLARVASKINVYDNNQCVAIISRRYKITWVKPPCHQDFAIWKKAELSTSDRFFQYLIDRQWLSALAALRDLRKICKKKKEYQEHWNMLHHLAQAHDQKPFLKRINAIHWS